MEETKVCRKCGGDPQPLSAFYRDNARPDGHKNSCKTCEQARKRTDEVRAQGRKYNNSEKGKAAERKYRDGEKYRETNRAYKSQPEVKARIRKRQPGYWKKYWYESIGRESYKRRMEDPARKARKAAEAAARIATPQGKVLRLAAVRKHYQKVGPLHQELRRTRKLSLPATLTPEEWQEAVDHFGGVCAYCGSSAKLHQDHFIPLALAGPYSAENIVPACQRCNSSKASKAPEEWCSVSQYERIVEYLLSRC